MKEKTYLIHQENREDYRVMNQTGVRQAITDVPTHNACWDAHLTPDGKLYFSLCSELTVGEYARLYTYDYENNKAIECFATKEILLKSDRYIRDSKFHTCIQTTNDGKLIMVTHTTDKAPQHIAWLPYSFVSNPWEGYPGGELMEYDPATGKVDLLGIPAPRESIYGAVYSPKDDAYYMLGYMRGHLYRYDRKTRKCADLGQASEYHCYRLVIGPDQNVYFSTRSGFLMRYNVDAGCIEDTGARIHCDKDIHDWPYTYMGPCVTGPDGRMYMTGNFTDKLSAYNVETGEMECLGKMIPADEYVNNDQQHAMLPGMAFDKYGVLWYVTMSFRDNEDEYYKVPSMLCRWDVLGGGEPEVLGLFGTVDRVQTHTDSFYIDKERDILYSVSTNHSLHSPDVIAVDLEKYRPVRHELGPVAEDLLIFSPPHEFFREFGDGWHNTKAAIRANSAMIKTKKTQPVRLWKQVPMAEIEDTAVLRLRWVDNDTVSGVCGKNKFYYFELRDGKLVRWEQIDEATAKEAVGPAPQNVEGLPSYPGRSWRSHVTAECPWRNGSKLVGTFDGFLAEVRAVGSVRSLGPATCQGPVRSLTADPEKGIAYGVGGDVEDVGNVFRYDEEHGLHYLGYMASDAWNDDVGACVNFVLSSCALSPDGTRLAIGGCDRMACAFVCHL